MGSIIEPTGERSRNLTGTQPQMPEARSLTRKGTAMTQAPSPSASTKELPQLLNVTQVAETLGVNVRHVRRLIYERRIPS